MSEQEIIVVAKQYFPKATLLNGKIRLTRGSGWHLPNHTIGKIKDKAIFEKVTELIDKGAVNLVASKTTHSYYLHYDGYDYRVSDHGKPSFIGKQVIINPFMK